MRKKIVANEESEGPVGEHDVLAELQPVFVRVAQHRFLGKFVVNDEGMPRYSDEGERRQKSRQHGPDESKLSWRWRRRGAHG